MLDFLGAHAIAGLETYEAGTFIRVMQAPNGPAVIALSPGIDEVRCETRAHPSDLPFVEARVRDLLDLDADPVAVDTVLAADPGLAPLVARRPGLRAPGTVDAFECVVRTVVGQQNSVSSTRPVLARMVAAYGERVDDDWTLFPTPAALAAADPESLPMPRARGRAIVGLAAAVASGEVGLDDRDALLGLRGIGPWTVDYLMMRTHRDLDVLLSTDLVVRRAAAELGLDLAGGRPDWAPYRSYATYHLWAHLVADLWSAAR